MKNPVLMGQGRSISLIFVMALVTVVVSAYRHKVEHRYQYPQLTGLVRTDNLRAFNPEVYTNTTKPIVLFFFCGCEPCHKTAQTFSRLVGKRSRNVICIFSGSPEDANIFVRQTHFPGLALTDANERLAENYGVTLCPRMFLLEGQRAIHTEDKGGVPIPEEQLSRIVRRL